MQQLFFVPSLALQHLCAGAVGQGLQPHQFGDLRTGINESLRALQRALDLGDMIAAVAPLSGQHFLPVGGGGMGGGSWLDHGIKAVASVVNGVGCGLLSRLINPREVSLAHLPTHTPAPPPVPRECGEPAVQAAP